MTRKTRNSKPETRRASRFAAERRGVLLLVILSLLFMFVLIAITYVLVTTRHLTISRQYGRLAATGHAQQSRKELDESLLQVLRGAAPAIDPTTFVEHYRSPIGPHSLLEDLYGNSARFQLSANAVLTAGNQLMEITAAPVGGFTPREDNGFYAGLVLTMTSGPAKGLSTRVVWSEGASGTMRFRVLPFKGTGGAITSLTYSASNPDKFIINGRPFTGTGFGFNPEVGRPTAMFDTDTTPGNGNSIAWALLPNPLSYNPLGSGNYDDPPFVANVEYQDGNQYSPSAMPATVASYYSAYPGNVPPFGGIGGANEDYDAVDFQNMAMAWLPPTPSTNDPIIPSFHRPALVRYFANPTGTYATIWEPPSGDKNALKRKVFFRPIGSMTIDATPLLAADADHPNFTGSTLRFDAVRGGDPTSGYTWDIDNDGDGVTDSVWLDLGYPVHSTADGRLYKPLFAILCVDLDGRVNVNAHGNIAQAAGTFSPIAPIQPFASGGPPLAGNAGGTLPVGSGFGPADAYPGALILSSVADQHEFVERLLGGDNVQSLEGRYGESSIANPLNRRPGVTNTGSDVNDPLSALRLFGLPPIYYGTTPLTSFMSPADVWGRRVVGLDVRGQPVYDAPVPNTDASYATYFTNESTNDPYELDLSASGPRPGGGAYATSSYYDNPFTAYELERILRPYDIDQPGLAPRLEKLIEKYVASSPVLPKQITTESFDIPMPPVELPSDMRTSAYLRSQGRRAFHVKDILRARIADGLGFATYPLTAAQEQQIEDQVELMLSWDLRAGRRMNINRPLGDGRDSDGNRVVDEPTVAELSQEGQTTANPSFWAQQFGGSVNFELDNGLYYGVDVDQSGTADRVDQGLMARQLMARHLFVLMMMLSNQGFFPPMPPNPAWQPMLPEALTDPQKKELLTRRIAQWAVNVVDFVDPDNIMTPFEYDANPFTNNDPTNHPNQTWEVDGIVDDGSTSLSNDDNTLARPNSDRRLVWGCEMPALLLTETLALHDRRVADTDKESPSGKDRGAPGDPPALVDTDLDQVLIPQGSAFFELYATHNPNAPAASGDLYTYDATAGWCLDLGRIAPAGDDGYDSSTPHSYAYPVWRLAISAAHLQINSARNYAFAQPETVSFDPQPSLLPPPPAGLGPAHAMYDRMCANLQTKVKFSVLDSPSLALDIPIERIVWFANPVVPPDTKMRDGKNIEIYYGRQFFNNPDPGNATPLLAAGRYALVGPRPITPIGSRKVAGTGQKWGEPSDQLIRLDAAPNTQVVTSANYPTTVTQQKPVLGIVAQVDKAVWNPGWTGPPIGISVSEPLPNNYYLQPTASNPLNPNTVSLYPGPPYPGYDQEAYDNLTTPTGTFRDAPFEKDTQSTLPVEQLPLKTRTATTINHRTVFLQRLANPLAHYHPITNPYLTVDWMPIDLTVFNGEDHVHEHASWAGSEGSWDEEDTNPEAKGPNTVFFGSHQRGKRSSFTGTKSYYNIWSQWVDTSDRKFLGGEDPEATDTPTPFPVSGDYNYFRHSLDQSISASNRGTLAYLNHGYGGPDLTTYIGEPERPFPWIAWNNRPYNSVFELMQVPASSPGRLNWEFGMVDTTGTPPNPYNNQNPPGGNSNFIRFPFRHLQNFFASANETVQPNFGRIFDYLEVPSPFVGTDSLLSPGSMASGAAGTDYLHPPFDSVSNFRDPGRVNINTIASEQVWNAVVGEPTLAIDFPDLHRSRQGWLTGSVYPTDFACPFRSYSSGDMVPRLFIGGDVDQLRHRGVNLTLLRAGRMGDGTPDPNLNDPDDYASPILPALLDTSTLLGAASQYKDGYRNPYFMYQSIDRLANLVTTHSNVYAVWVTVGYFEVTPAPGSPYNPLIYPDGYQLGQELGMDTGDVDRHRAFYIIDRSIPVGFQRGQNHNVEKAILLKRFIE